MLRVEIHRQLAALTLDMRFELASDVLVLFGASGSGKSMTLKMIAGIERPDRGVIQANDRRLFDSAAGINLPPQERHIGYVPQQYALFPHLTAHANIALPLRKGLRWPAARADARAREMLELVGLADRGATHPRELSGGQQQRVALARALAVEPEVLLLDEPFAALDAPIRAELRAEFRQIQQAMRVPAIFVTHDLEEAVAVSRQLAVVVNGQIRQVGPARDILDRPADVHVAELVQSRNIIPGTLVRTGDHRVARTALGDLPLGPTLLADGADVFVIIRPEEIRIVRDDRPIERLRNDTLLSGRVTSFVDHGTRAVVTLDIGGIALEASLSPTAARRVSAAPGNDLRVTIPSSAMHAIAAGTSRH
jgi:molybdate transport system ATP-binding protein